MVHVRKFSDKFHKAMDAFDKQHHESVQAAKETRRRIDDSTTKNMSNREYVNLLRKAQRNSSDSAYQADLEKEIRHVSNQ